MTIPNTFSDGTPALASEVNANFQALASAVNAVRLRHGSGCGVQSGLELPRRSACDTLGSYNLASPTAAMAWT